MESGPPGPELHVTPAVVSIYQSHDSDHDFLLNISFQLTLQMVTVWISSAIRDLLFIQQNKFYWISNRSGVAELIQTVYLSNSHFMSQDPPPCFWGVTPPRVIQTTVQATWVAGGPFTKMLPNVRYWLTHRILQIICWIMWTAPIRSDFYSYLFRLSPITDWLDIFCCHARLNSQGSVIM